MLQFISFNHLWGKKLKRSDIYISLFRLRFLEKQYLLRLFQGDSKLPMHVLQIRIHTLPPPPAPPFLILKILPSAFLIPSSHHPVLQQLYINDKNDTNPNHSKCL